MNLLWTQTTVPLLAPLWGTFRQVRASQVVQAVKNPPANTGDVRDTGSITGLGRSPRRGHGNPLQYSCLENPTDREAWQVTVHRVAKSQIRPKWPRMHTHIQFSSVAQSCPTLCNPMNRSTPGLPVHHHLSEFTQTHVHRVRDPIQPSHPRLSPSPPASNPSQHQSLFQWVNFSHEVAKVLEFQL